LSIGSVVGGAGLAARQWNEPLTRLTRRIAELQAGVVTPLNVNVVYHVPGEILAPDYEGVRTGRFSRRDSLLMVQAAVPSSAEDKDAVLRALLLQAIDEAERWAKRRGVANDLGQLRRLAEDATAPAV
jgi:hypothetical protein